MGLYRRGKTYWFTIMDEGRRIQKSTGTPNRKLAERIYATALRDVHEGKWFEQEVRRTPFMEMVDRYRTEYTNQKDYMQKARDMSIFKHLIGFFGKEALLKDVIHRTGEYEHFRRGQITRLGAPPGSGTIRKELALLRRMFNIARKQWKWSTENPVSNIELPRESKHRIRYLSEDEYTRLFKALEEDSTNWIKPITVLALNTGLRLNNLCSLTWDEVNLFSGVIYIASEKMKNNEYHGIPLNESARRLLLELRKVRSLSNHVLHDNGKQLHNKKVHIAFRRVMARAEIDDFRFHDLRHTFASYLRQKGADLDIVSKLLGHKDLRMTLRYAHMSLEPLRDSIRLLDGPLFARQG